MNFSYNSYTDSLISSTVVLSNIACFYNIYDQIDREIMQHKTREMRDTRKGKKDEIK